MIKAKIKKLWSKALIKTLDVLGIGTVTFTATTLNQGTLDISGYLPTNAYPLTVECTGRTAFGLFAGRNWIRIETWDGSPIANAQVTLKIYYVRKVGGVLRNLSIFKAFRHFMPLQKGGGVDGQGCNKEADIQNTWHADRIRYAHNNGMRKAVDFPQSRTYGVLRCSERYTERISGSNNTRKYTRTVSSNGTTEDSMWKPFEFKLLCANRGGRKCNSVYANCDSISNERSILCNVPIGLIGSSISGRRWAA